MNSKSKEVFERIKQCCESACLGLGQSPYNRFLQSITPCREDLEVLQQDLDKLETLEKEYQELKELVEFLIKHLYVASELLELRVAPKHNHRWDGWQHNGIKVQNDDFWKYIKLINKLKKEIGNYE